MLPVHAKTWGFRPNPAVAAEIATLDAERDCQRIVHLLTAYEFPFDITRALEVALFYTYGSDTVSALLDRTGEFRNHGQKRYDDTRLLIAHFMDTGWDGDVGRRAIARMNASHAHFRIPNDDFLFVLWTFIDFPIWWMGHFGRRPFTRHEQLAWFTFWHTIGGKMGLRDIPASKAAFDQFVDQYKRVHFVPCEASRRVAEATVTILENWFPAPLRPLVSPVVYALQEDPQFLRAVGATPSPRWLGALVRGSLRLLGRLQRHVVITAYPQTQDSVINRTYPDNRYEIEELAPDRLRQAEAVKAGRPESGASAVERQKA